MTFAVFLVEDDPVLRRQLTDLINDDCDAKVVATAETEAEALAWINAHPNEWHLMVLDLYLRQGTGFGVLSEIPDAHTKQKVIVLSNTATADNRSVCLALGARAIYDKTTELSEFLAHCLRHRQQTA